MLLRLWRLRLWVAIGIPLAIVAALGSVKGSSSPVYASASTQMLVDSPASALANAGADMTGYLSRANVFARLMTSAEALRYIGQAAGVPGNLIDANGPVETNGSATATHAPVQIQGGKDLPAPATYKLSFLQNPDLPTVDVYAQAPTTAQAIRLANGAVTGFANFIVHLDGNNVPLGKRIEVRQLGGATGGLVDAGASKKIALLVFVAVLSMWCGLVLFVSRLRAQLRVAKAPRSDDEFAVPAAEPTSEELAPDELGPDELTPTYTPRTNASADVRRPPARFGRAADGRVAEEDPLPFGPARRTTTRDTWDPASVLAPRPEDAPDEVGLRP